MRIAICEDDHAQIKLTESYILRWAEANAVDVEIETFNSAESFLFRWPHPMEFDVVFLDIQMGGMSGIELAKKIRKQDDRMSIVFVTGLKEYVLRGYDVRALHYLLKPVTTYLRVAAVKGQLYIEVENSTDGRVKTKDGRFLTTKDRRFHGVGLRQIDAIARKYNGYSGRSFEGNVFTTVVSLPVCYV